MSDAVANKIHWKSIIPPSLLVAGNVLGVGILALPIKLGVSGYLPSVLDITVICLVMLVSAFVIAERLPADKKNFDIPSFFHQELGVFGKWVAIICNLILLYGVLIAYLSGISSILHALIPVHISDSLIILLYFLLATSLVIFGRKVLRRGNTILLIAIVICFFVLVLSGVGDFHLQNLGYFDWKFLPIGLPVAVSAFHFHNIIPTTAVCVEQNKKALRIAITVGVVIGFIMNLIWVTVVLGSLSQFGSHGIVSAFLHNVPATVPMTKLLHSRAFTTSGLLFATLAVTASYVANGAGLFGFVRDLTFRHIGTENRVLISTIAFLPPLLVTIIYPHIFLVALDIVGGVGETILFAILPGLILIRLSHKKSPQLTSLGYTVTSIGLFVLLFLIAEKLGIVHLLP